jgi:hypothetical protein
MTVEIPSTYIKPSQPDFKYMYKQEWMNTCIIFMYSTQIMRGKVFKPKHYTMKAYVGSGGKATHWTEVWSASCSDLFSDWI